MYAYKTNASCLYTVVSTVRTVVALVEIQMILHQRLLPRNKVTDHLFYTIVLLCPHELLYTLLDYTLLVFFVYPLHDMYSYLVTSSVRDRKYM